jgi:hypothetical protein
MLLVNLVAIRLSLMSASEQISFEEPLCQFLKLTLQLRIYFATHRILPAFRNGLFTEKFVVTFWNLHLPKYQRKYANLKGGNSCGGGQKGVCPAVLWSIGEIGVRLCVRRKEPGYFQLQHWKPVFVIIDEATAIATGRPYLTAIRGLALGQKKQTGRMWTIHDF